MLALDLNIIQTHNIKTIGIADASVYPTNFIINSPSLEITPPGFTKVNLPFIAKSVNVFNSNNLLITNCTDESLLSPLPDGIYKVKFSVQPAIENYVEKSFFRIDNLKCKYSKAHLSVDLDCDGCSSYANSKNILQRIRLLMDGVIASANECDEVSAMKKYKQALELLKTFKNCDCK